MNKVMPLNCQNPVQMASCRHHIVVPTPPLDTVPAVHALPVVPHHPDSGRCGSDGLVLFSLAAGHAKNYAGTLSHQITSRNSIKCTSSSWEEV